VLSKEYEFAAYSGTTSRTSQRSEKEGILKTSSESIVRSSFAPHDPIPSSQVTGPGGFVSSHRRSGNGDLFVL
jgi:hypothetical protein